MYVRKCVCEGGSGACVLGLCVIHSYTPAGYLCSSLEQGLGLGVLLDACPE